MKRFRSWSLIFGVSAALLLPMGCSGPSGGEATADAPLSPPPAVIVPDGSAPQTPLDRHVPGVANFGFVSADLWRGARPTPLGFSALAAMGVRTVIDLEERNASAEMPAGVQYVSLPVPGWRADRVNTAKVLRAIEQMPKPIFIHCREGRDRTGLAVAAYRVAHGMSAEDAMREMRNFHVRWMWQGSMGRRLGELQQSLAAAKDLPVRLSQ
jgi:protein tyrosine phosphatase (PTP) superfamily phosphohydrolase (DUF442 family)